MNLDLGGLVWTQVAIAAVIVGVIDTLTGIVGAIGGGTFSPSFVATFLSTHVLNRIIPIIGAALLSTQLGAGTASQTVFGVALVGLGAYIVETLPSVAGNLGAVSLPSIAISRKPKAAPIVPPPVVPPVA
jgi:hypothetical protein